MTGGTVGGSGSGGTNGNGGTGDGGGDGGTGDGGGDGGTGGTGGSTPSTPSTAALTASAGATPTDPLVGQAVAFTGSASGGTGPYTYAWDFGDGGTGSGSGPSHAYAADGDYTATLTVTDATGATATATVSLSVTGAALTATATGPTGAVAAGEVVGFAGSASGGSGTYTFAWDFGDGGTSTEQDPDHAYEEDGTYTATLIVTDTVTGETAEATVEVDVSGAASAADLTAGATATPTAPAAGEAVAFAGSASGGSGSYTFGWAFGDGTTGSGQNPSHTYADAGTYTATLTVTDDDTGDEATAEVTVTVAAATPANVWIASAPDEIDDGEAGTVVLHRQGGISADALTVRLGFAPDTSDGGDGGAWGVDYKVTGLDATAPVLNADGSVTAGVTFPAGATDVRLTVKNLGTDPNAPQKQVDITVLKDVPPPGADPQYTPGEPVLLAGGLGFGPAFMTAPILLGAPAPKKYQVTATAATLEDFTQQAEKDGPAAAQEWYKRVKTNFGLTLDPKVDPNGVDRKKWGPKDHFAIATKNPNAVLAILQGAEFDAMRFHVTGIDGVALGDYLMQTVTTTVNYYQKDAAGLEQKVGNTGTSYLVEGFGVDNKGDATRLDTHTNTTASIGPGNIPAADLATIRIDFEIGWGHFGNVGAVAQSGFSFLYSQGNDGKATKWADGDIHWNPASTTKDYSLLFTLNVDGTWSFTDTAIGVNDSGQWDKTI